MQTSRATYLSQIGSELRRRDLVGLHKQCFVLTITVFGKQL